jgi:hypothetical protein
MLINCSVRGASRKSKAEQYNGQYMEETLPDTGDFILLDLILLENISKIPKKKKKEEKEETKM